MDYRQQSWCNTHVVSTLDTRKGSEGVALIERAVSRCHFVFWSNCIGRELVKRKWRLVDAISPITTSRKIGFDGLIIEFVRGRCAINCARIYRMNAQWIVDASVTKWLRACSSSFLFFSSFQHCFHAISGRMISSFKKTLLRRLKRMRRCFNWFRSVVTM